MKATFLAERFSFPFIFKPITALWKCPDLSQIGAAPFSPFYPFILLSELTFICSSFVFRISNMLFVFLFIFCVKVVDMQSTMYLVAHMHQEG